MNPYYEQATQCDKCNGTGHSEEYNRLLDRWYGNAPFGPEDRAWRNHLNSDDVKALLDAGRLWDFTRAPRTDAQRETVRLKVEAGGNSWLPEDNGYVPTPEEVNAWSISGFGHDSINAWIVIKAECARLGYPTDCDKCEDGSLWPSPEIAKLAEDWKESEPPTGDGYQLWETTSEGSPSSPVFATMDELCEWGADNASTFGSSTATAQQWREMLDADFVCHRDGNAIFLSLRNLLTRWRRRPTLFHFQRIAFDGHRLPGRERK